MSNQRWMRILELLKDRPEITVEDLVQTLGVSQSTVRRDLRAMEDQNLLIRYHGGARPMDGKSTEHPLAIRALLNTPGKKSIARYAASLIQDHQMIYLEGGSTTFEMIPYIRAKHISVVTNGIQHALELDRRGITTFLLCGLIEPKTVNVFGKQTLALLSQMRFDTAFMGTNGIHQAEGLTVHYEYGADSKAQAIRNAKTAYVLADCSKFNILCLHKFADLKDVTIITDKPNPSFDYTQLNSVVFSESLSDAC